MNRKSNESYYLKVQPKCNLYNKMEIQACLRRLGDPITIHSQQGSETT